MVLLIIIVPAVAIFAFAACALIKRRRFSVFVNTLVNELYQKTETINPNDYDLRKNNLPKLIQAHLDNCIRTTYSAKSLHIKHTGEMRQSPNSKWFKITGEEYFDLLKPGFVWHGMMNIGGLIWIDVCDHLINGKGNMLVKAWSMIKINDERGEAIDQGSYLRWLGELVWFPIGFCGSNLEFKELSEDSVQVCVVDNGKTFSAEFFLGSDGKIKEVRAMRFRQIGRESVLTPWKVRVSNYVEFSGQFIPTNARVFWELPEGEFECIRMEIQSAVFNED